MAKILGISAFYHDSASALVVDGEVISAVQEERFTRIKHDPSFPERSIEYIFKENNLGYKDVDYVCFYEKPFLKFERLIETYLGISPYGFKSFQQAMPLWIKEKLFQKYFLLKKIDPNNTKNLKNKLLFSEHHLSHAASAFFPSPFKESAILTLDGVGEWATTTIGHGHDNNIDLIEEMHFPHSIGLLYSAFTYFLGFRVNDGEYKVMGLAPYGQPKYSKIILNKILDLKEDGSFRLNMKYFNYMGGLEMTSKHFSELFSMQKRETVDEINKSHMDLASSIQKVTEIITTKIVQYVHRKYKTKNLCLAGGVALNCVSNSQINNLKLFDNIWVQPAGGDSGGALGAALIASHKKFEIKRNITKSDGMKNMYLGPKYSDHQIEDTLKKYNILFEKYKINKLVERTAQLLAKGKIIGWFNGRMEFGPRALGSRSIIADPRSPKMQEELNMRVKFREGFRPFAPSIMLEDIEEWFNTNKESPYMTFVEYIAESKRMRNKENLELNGFELLKIKRSEVSAVTHLDYSSRIQTVSKDKNPRFHQLINEFKKITGCPMIVNTSFNLKDQPIVCNPKDAIECFLETNLDFLMIESYCVWKS